MTRPSAGGRKAILFLFGSGRSPFFRLPRNESLSVNERPFQWFDRRRSDGRTIGFISRCGGRPQQEGTARAQAPRGYRVRRLGEDLCHEVAFASNRSTFNSNRRFPQFSNGKPISLTLTVGECWASSVGIRETEPVIRRRRRHCRRIDRRCKVIFVKFWMVVRCVD